MMRDYKGQRVFVVNRYKFGGVSYVDLKNEGTGELFESIPVSKLNNNKKTKEVTKESVGKTVIFQNGDAKTELEEDSTEYKKFIRDNKLNPKFVANCLKGITKTHKGFKISYK